MGELTVFEREVNARDCCVSGEGVRADVRYCTSRRKTQIIGCLDYVPSAYGETSQPWTQGMGSILDDGEHLLR